MPLYDNINDALALTQDGASHVVSLDCAGATFENDEATNGEGWEGVWVKIDLSTYPAGENVEILVELQKTGGDAGYEPYMDTMKVVDASFDPAAPVFTKLDFPFGTGDQYVGDGTSNPTNTITLQGGTGVSTGIRSLNGIFYLIFTDWNFVGYGAADFTYTIPPVPICFAAEDIINPDSTTASVVSARVRETWDKYWDYGAQPTNVVEHTLGLTWSGPSGLYKMNITGQNAGSAVSGNVWALVTVNGKPITSVAVAISGTGTSGASYHGYSGPAGAYESGSDYASYPWVPLKAGDVVEIMIVSTLRTSGFAFVAFDVEDVCFQGDMFAPATSYCTPVFDFPVTPLGDVWGSANGWGGQQLIPDQIWTHLGITPYDEAEFPWGVNYVDFDIAPLEDGTVYVIFHDRYNAAVNPAPFNQEHYIVVKKYDPGPDSWTQIHTLNIRDVTDGYEAEAVTAHYDGTYVYFTWWELETYTAGAPPTDEWLWHCKRLDPSDDSVTELGTGQATQGITNQVTNFPNSQVANSIAVSGDDVYVSSVETVDDGSYDYRLYVWRWNGSTWTDIALPDPSLTNAGVFEILGENGFYDQLGPMVAARADGPATDGITIVYSYRYLHTGTGIDRYPLVTIDYTVGTGWANEILTDWAAVEGADRLEGTDPPGAWRRVAVDLNVMWSARLGRLVLAGDLLVGAGQGTDYEIWDVWQMNDAGDQWEIIEASPAAVAGDWRQSRNTAAIGPDGNVFRGMMGSWNDESPFGGIISFIPMLVKHSPGYGPGWSNGARRQPGEDGDMGAAFVTMYSTTHVPLKVVGNDAYVMVNVYAEELDGASWWADAFYVFKLTYVDCVLFYLASLRASIPL